MTTKTTPRRRPLTKKQKIEILASSEVQLIDCETGANMFKDGVKLEERAIERMLRDKAGKLDIVNMKLTWQKYPATCWIFTDIDTATAVALLA